MAIKQKITGFVFLFVSFSVGLFAFLISNKASFVERDPAAVEGKLFHFNNLTTEQLHDELVSKIKIKPVITSEKPGKAIIFQGLSANLCQSYAEIELIFEGDGTSASGHPTKMKITAVCAPGQDPSELAAIILPIKEILREKPRDAEFSFSGYKGRFHFSNVTDQWPTVWILRSIEFKNAAANATHSANAAGISAASPRHVEFSKSVMPDLAPLVLEF